jgi:LPXTG-motif cell wall-anchored protein
VTGFAPVRRIAALAGLLGVAVAVTLVPLAGTASAEPDYPPVFNKITASSFVVPRGGSITFTARTFVAGSNVTFSASAGGKTVVSGSAVANAAGKVVQGITFDVVGTNTVTFSGTSSKGKPLVLGVEVTVTDGSSGGGSGDNGGTGGTAGTDNGTSAGGIPFISGLPRTGAQIAATVAMGAALLAAGIFLVAATRRRRHHHA